ncbi:MAG: VWA domain-containing protein [Desulfobacterales bacterium]|nr:VWA domain-containing protein [Desulfobacterales bacterium]
MMDNLLQFDVVADKQYRPVEGEFVIRLGLRISVSDLAETLPLNICLLIDSSTSMAGERIQKTKDAAKSIVSNLREDDLLSVVSFSTKPELVVDSKIISSDVKNHAMSAIDALRADGVTRMDLALETAYNIFNKENRDNYMNVLLVLSDGAPTNDEGYHLKQDGLENIADMISKTYVKDKVKTSTIWLGQAKPKFSDFLETCADKGGGKFYHAETEQVLIERFMEELNRIIITAISDVKFIFSDVHGKIRKSAAVYPDVRELDDPKQVKDGFEIEGGALQKGEEHVFLTEIITPPYSGDTDKKVLCQIIMKYLSRGKEHIIQGKPVFIEYTDDEDLLQKDDHPDVSKYKDQYMQGVLTQKANQLQRQGGDSKKTKMYYENAAKLTRKLGNIKQTRKLEEIVDKISTGTAVTEDDIIAASVGSKKTKVLDIYIG